MQSLMDRFLGGRKSGKFDWRPTTDMYRENGTLVIKAELPGLDPARDIEIAVEDDLLTIRGQKSADQEGTEKDRFMKERMFGTLSGAFRCRMGSRRTTSRPHTTKES